MQVRLFLDWAGVGLGVRDQRLRCMNRIHMKNDIIHQMLNSVSTNHCIAVHAHPKRLLWPTSTWREQEFVISALKA